MCYLIEYINLLGYNETISKTKNLIVVKVPNSNRVNAINHIAKEIGGEYLSTPSYISSLGFIKYQNYKIIVKPVEKQGDGSAGKANELFVLSKLNQHISNFKDNVIVFKDKHNEYSFNSIESIEDISNKNFRKRHKTDLKLHTNSGLFNLSIKKSDAEIWESADSYAGHLVQIYVEKLINEGIAKFKENDGIKILYPNIAIECSDKEAQNVIFGSDLGVDDLIVVNTFNDSNFTYNDNILEINCDHIINDISHIKQYQKPWFLIRNDCTRNCGYKGIRVLACYEKRISNNVYKISLNERID